MPSPLTSFKPRHAASPRGIRDHVLNSLLIVTAVVAGSYVIGLFVPRGPRVALEGARASQDFHALEREYTRLVDADVHDLENHRGLLAAHLSIPKEIRTRHSTIVRDDSRILERYDLYTRSEDPKVRDIGFYGLGYYFADMRQPDKALESFDRVGDRAMPYLNNSIGHVYLHDKRQPDRARPCFEKEIAVKGNVAGAVANLSELDWEGRNLDAMDALADDADLGRFVPLHARRELDLAERRYGAYLATLFRSETGGVTWMSLLSSLLMAAMFLLYIYFVDTFEKERVSLLVAIFAMGVLSAVLASVFYDLAEASFGLHESGQWGRDLRFYVLGVGLIEETVKVIPVLIAAFVWKKWNESVDILVFAAVSALGFACMENIGYFSHVAIGLIVGRALSAVVLHVCLTSLAVYGLFHRRYAPGSAGVFWVAGCFGAAVVAHGLYDFFLSGAVDFGIVSTLILIYMIVVFRNMLVNALDQSEFLTQGSFRIDLARYLFYGVLGILLMQYAILAIPYGTRMSLASSRS